MSFIGRCLVISLLLASMGSCASTRKAPPLPLEIEAPPDTVEVYLVDSEVV